MCGQLEVELKRFLKTVLLEVWQECQQSEGAGTARGKEAATSAWRLLTGREAAKLLAISERHLSNLTKAGLIPAIRLGHAVRYELEAVRRAVDNIEKGSQKNDSAMARLTKVVPKRNSKERKEAKANNRSGKRTNKRSLPELSGQGLEKTPGTGLPSSKELSKRAAQCQVKSKRDAPETEYKTGYIRLVESMGLVRDELPIRSNGDLRDIMGVDLVTLHGWQHLGKPLPEEALQKLVGYLKAHGQQQDD